MFISILRALILYVIVMVSIKFMGKRQISELQTSELVITFFISDIASIPIQNTSQPMLSGIIPIAVLVCCEIFVSILMAKFPKFRYLICGRAIIVIDNGKILQKKLNELRINADELIDQLRQMNVFYLKDVAFAIIETNGKLSVVKKSDKDPPSASALSITVPEFVFETVIVSNGKISDFSLDICNLHKQWLEGILQAEKVKLEDIFLMTANKNKEFNIIKKE